MAIHDWPEGEQPRHKFLHQGPNALSDAELLAIFLRTGVKGQSAVDLSRNLIKKFGSLSALLNSNQQEFCNEKGLGISKYVQIQAILELAKRHLLAESKSQVQLNSVAKAKEYLMMSFRDLRHEKFAVVFLDVQHRVIEIETLFTGTLNETRVYPREVVKRALDHHAGGVILAHNHPSGDTTPSIADKEMTWQLQEALSWVEVNLLDHLIIGHQGITSIAEMGLLNRTTA